MKAPSGSSRVPGTSCSAVDLSPAKTEIPVAKIIQAFSLCKTRRWSTFPITLTGKPANRSDRQETARTATQSQRETGGGRSTAESQRETGGGRFWTARDRETGNKPPTRGQRETGGNGGRETDGDPSGSSRVNRPASRKACTSTLETRKRAAFGSHQPLASANGELPSGVRSPAGFMRRNEEPREG